ncbi:Branched-chain amino acid ABC transporter permease [Petrocella atlantisensis]|uniref:Branched-chain amino acid ABC transporter permease n=1 Tax=Petrocella atlantisensis TaxID=2173034 RepID=A0A3P7P569_9FIRM|nr:branched-chain amino acid ABC transporter permease [Petrocella atlantisensis]MCF8020744.1 branched-chain amino acid ABC transporter permease [Vallitaleaceae bacterium]VDN48700.1 Branched-chain amino acid ABC transporter permease [Petrocella atlantisensis]
MKNKKTQLTILLLIVTIAIIAVLNITLDSYKIKIFTLCGIYIILGLSMNLINGFTGLFSLGHAGFMAVGAYVSALLTMSPELKDSVFYVAPINPFIKMIQLPFPLALIVGGLVAAGVAFLIGAPVLRLNDDYLAIATLGFSEIIRVVITNTQTLTNGSLGLKGITRYTNAWWAWGIAILTIFFMIWLIHGMYGKAFKAIREDEIAAEAMGISLFKHKMMSFVIGAFFAGVGGGLLGHLIGAIDPNMFRFILTFNILLIVVLGGIGSITGTIISATAVTILMEVLRFIESPINLGFINIPGIPGMRMVVFSLMLMGVILFYPKGLMGRAEFNWDYFLKKKFLRNRKKSA